jgi:uncharacterized RDD family membrane protein YckC
MDRDVEIRTPESVAFDYQLAGVGSRFLAIMSDLFLQVLVAISFLLIFGYIVSLSHFFPRSHAEESVEIALVIFLFFLIFSGYFVLFEAFWNGQTPGKKLLGIRVVKDGGYPIDFSASLIRNLIRVAEQMIGFYAISVVSALISPENKRIGDYAAGTIVVREGRIPSPATLAQPALPYAATSLLSGEERKLVHHFIERRASLAPSRRAELASRLAQRIRPRVSAELGRLDDESLLERL